MKHPETSPSSPAFTRIELAVVLAVLALLAALALPSLATSRNRSEQITCLNNLRQIGLALRVWGNDHNDQVPWRTPWCEGGLMMGSLASPTCGSDYPPQSGGGTPINWGAWINNPFIHWMWISNDLAQPRVLACPSDDAARVARDWSTSPAGGFLNANFRNNAVSYFIGLDVNFRPDLTRMVVAGDRNMNSNAYPVRCSAGVSLAAAVTAYPLTIRWVDAIHRDSGNLLLLDGSAYPATTPMLREVMHILDDNGQLHFLYPLR